MIFNSLSLETYDVQSTLDFMWYILINPISNRLPSGIHLILGYLLLPDCIIKSKQMKSVNLVIRREAHFIPRLMPYFS